VAVGKNPDEMTVTDIEAMPTQQVTAEGPHEKKKDPVEIEMDTPSGKGKMKALLSKLASQGTVELRGSAPVPYEERTVTRYLDIFSIWFCMSCNPLP
jgi:hypothetical protein